MYVGVYVFLGVELELFGLLLYLTHDNLHFILLNRKLALLFARLQMGRHTFYSPSSVYLVCMLINPLS